MTGMFTSWYFAAQNVISSPCWGNNQVLLTGSPSTRSPLGPRITMTTCAWKVIISTGPWSMIFPMASYTPTNKHILRETDHVHWFMLAAIRWKPCCVQSLSVCCVLRGLHLCCRYQGSWTGTSGPELWPAGWGEPADCKSGGNREKNEFSLFNSILALNKKNKHFNDIFLIYFIFLSTRLILIIFCVSNYSGARKTMYTWRSRKFEKAIWRSTQIFEQKGYTVEKQVWQHHEQTIKISKCCCSARPVQSTHTHAHTHRLTAS